MQVTDDSQYADISEKVKKYRRYETLAGRNPGFIFLLLCLPFLLFLPFGIIFNIQLSNTYGFVLVFISFFLVMGITTLAKRKQVGYHVDDGEWAIFYARPLYVHITKCLEKKNPEGVKKDHRKKALKNAESLLLCIQERWNVGTFKPIKEFEKGSVAAFKKNLRYRIIPAIKEGDDPLLQKVESIIYNFLFTAKTLCIEDIIQLNEKMSGTDGLPNREPLKIGYFSRFSGFMKSNKVSKHIFFVVLIALGCVMFAFLLVYWELSKESVVSDSIILFGILVSAYIAIQWSANRPSSSA